MTKDYFTCDETTPPKGYGPGIHHSDVRAPSSSGQTINLDFCQFDVSSFCVCLSYLSFVFQTPDPLEADYLTIHPNPTGISKYYGPSLNAADAPPKWTEYPGVRYPTVCFKARSIANHQNGYLAEVNDNASS